jgi:hypothetical protein
VLGSESDLHGARELSKVHTAEVSGLRQCGHCVSVQQQVLVTWYTYSPRGVGREGGQHESFD